MSDTLPSAAHSGAPAVPGEPIWRLSVEQYHRMIQAEILTDDDQVELLEGWLVATMVKKPAHETAARLVQRSLERAMPPGWEVGKERPITLASQDSEPEPDVIVMRGDVRQYAGRHPGPGDVELVVEVADSSLDRDRGPKKRLYAAARLPVYWIVNLIERSVEVYTLSGEHGERPDYGPCVIYRAPDAIPLGLEGREVARIPVADLLP